MTLSRKIFLALGLGIALGLVFGEKLRFLGIFGTAFVQLLQITVLPYVAGSLMVDYFCQNVRNPYYSILSIRNSSV